MEPHNIYGVSKSCGEKLIVNAQHNYISNTSFICVRAGNVVGTNGSIFPLFKKQLLNDNIITVTNPEMTRFIMKTEDAIELIFHAVRDLVKTTEPVVTLVISQIILVDVLGTNTSSSNS